MNRRDWLKSAFGGAAAMLVADSLLARPVDAAKPHAMTVYKSPSCGCCGEWVKHVRAAGFAVTVKDVGDAQLSELKSTLGVPDALQSCHTGVVGGYSVEGHVPADVIQKALREKPAGTLLAVPGMPVGSPGMEVGSRKDRYDVVLYDRRTRRSRVYASR